MVFVDHVVANTKPKTVVLTEKAEKPNEETKKQPKAK